MAVAAIVGREFEIALLRRLLPQLQPEQLLDALEEALLAGFIEETFGATGRYQFTHVLMQETLSQEFSAIRQAGLHGKIGEALEQLHADDLESRLDRLAFHFSEAEPAIGSAKMIR